MTKKGQLICLTGIDGSGKTTLSRRLQIRLESPTSSITYVYGRHQPFLILPLMKLGGLIFHKNSDRNKDYQEYSRSKQSSIGKHKLLARIYQTLLLYEYYGQVFLKIYIPLVFGKKTIITDRYVFDTVITDLAIDFRLSYEEMHHLLSHMLTFLPIPDVIFLIDTPEEIAFARKSDTPSLEYLKERRSLYLRICGEYGAIILDGSLSLESLENRMEQVIREKSNA